MKTLYIDINNSPVPSDDKCEVYAAEDLELNFYIYLGTLIDVNNEAGDPYCLVNDFNTQQTQTDFEKIKDEWGKLKKRLFSQNCTGSYPFPLPLAYISWLQYANSPIYQAWCESGGQQDVEIDLDDLYDQCLGRLQRGIVRLLEEKSGEIDEIVFNDDAVNRFSRIVREIREKYQNVGFVRHQEFKRSAPQPSSSPGPQSSASSPSVSASPKQWKNKEVRTFRVNGVPFDMVYVEGGEFIMGSGEYEDEAKHRVSLSSYFIGQTQVTQELWEAVMGGNPSKFRGFDRPVESVSWNDCQEFVKKLNDLLKAERANLCFSLPTESQWEYAARGGKESKESKGYMYSGSNNLNEVAWYEGNSGKKTYPVKQKKANELGLYDMSGNVWEWCNDWYEKNYPTVPQTDPKGPQGGQSRVMRGGSWYRNAVECRSALRSCSSPGNAGDGLGLRLALSR